MNHRVVLYFEKITPVTQVDFLWFPTANLFVAFPTNFLADQNLMTCVGVDLTLHFRDEAVAGLPLWNIDLN